MLGRVSLHFNPTFSAFEKVKSLLAARSLVSYIIKGLPLFLQLGLSQMATNWDVAFPFHFDLASERIIRKLETFCLSSSVQVLPLDVTTPRDSYAWSYREPVTLLTESESLAEGGFEPPIIWSICMSLTTELSWHLEIQRASDSRHWKWKFGWGGIRTTDHMINLQESYNWAILTPGNTESQWLSSLKVKVWLRGDSNHRSYDQFAWVLQLSYPDTWKYREPVTLLAESESLAEGGFEPPIIWSICKSLTTELSWHLEIQRANDSLHWKWKFGWWGIRTTDHMINLQESYNEAILTLQVQPQCTFNM